MILRILFILLAALCKSLVDTIAFHKGGVFQGNKFFDINQQGKFIPHTKYPFDGFHVFNSLMIVFFVAATCTITRLPNLVNLVGLGIVFNLVFNFCWNKVFVVHSFALNLFKTTNTVTFLIISAVFAAISFFEFGNSAPAVDPDFFQVHNMPIAIVSGAIALLVLLLGWYESTRPAE